MNAVADELFVEDQSLVPERLYRVDEIAIVAEIRKFSGIDIDAVGKLAEQII
ncbi:hypothetical protein [Sphingomonas oligophenolica]|uniref:hypothetical protein n=1 Tax=Sphingomonas oligophenolica TaxID=301154 RepID=UPI0031D553DB